MDTQELKQKIEEIGRLWKKEDPQKILPLMEEVLEASGVMIACHFSLLNIRAYINFSLGKKEEAFIDWCKIKAYADECNLVDVLSALYGSAIYLLEIGNGSTTLLYVEDIKFELETRCPEKSFATFLKEMQAFDPEEKLRKFLEDRNYFIDED